MVPWVEETKYGSIQLGQKKTKENRPPGSHLGGHIFCTGSGTYNLFQAS